MYKSKSCLFPLGFLLFLFCSCDQNNAPSRSETDRIIRSHSRAETVVNGKIKLIIDGKDGEGEVVVGSGQAKSEKRELDTFSHVETRLGVGVKVVRGESANVTIKTDDNILPVILTEVRGGKLIIDASQSFSSSMPINLLVETPELSSASTSGSGQIFLDNVSDQSLQLEINGSGGIGGQGKIESISASINGSGKLSLDKFVAQEVSVSISGSGTAKVQAIKTLDAAISGSGTINYIGQPEKLNRSITGSGDVKQIAR